MARRQLLLLHPAPAPYSAELPLPPLPTHPLAVVQPAVSIRKLQIIDSYDLGRLFVQVFLVLLRIKYFKYFKINVKNGMVI